MKTYSKLDLFLVFNFRQREILKMFSPMTLFITFTPESKVA